jgi:hypothetical protein
MKCDELEKFDAASNADLSAGYNHRYAYEADEVDSAIAELKEALHESENARYEAGADAADYYQENRKLKRALWLARAEWARSSALSYHLIESNPDKDVSATCKRKANKWEKAKDKCLKKAEEYK